MKLEIIDNFDESEESESETGLVSDVTKLSDETLARMAGAGDEEAVVELIKRHPELGATE